MNKKLWGDKFNLDKFIETFETEGDLLMDQKLLPYDLKGSFAHAKMLLKIGILNEEEFLKLEKGLKEISKLYKKGKFTLEVGNEDMHTKIENYLIEHYGKAGEKIHTARSRNDQVLTAIRLFSKDYLEEIEKEVVSFIKEFQNFSKEFGEIKMPGYTHMQKAMPSSVKLWVESFISSLEDDLCLIRFAIKINDKSPLGAGAGYGLPIEIDRIYTAKFLGFSKVEESVIYTQNSRGKVEGVTLSALISVLQTINKFASDLMLFSTAEFNFFEISGEVLTGSSIMPQKKNLDLAELLRSKVHLVLGNYVAIVSLSSNLITGYNRDLQDSKKPLIESLEITNNSLKAAQILLKNIVPNKKVLEKSMSEELYAAEKAFKLVKTGISFRDAYIKVSKEIFKEKGGEKND